MKLEIISEVMFNNEEDKDMMEQYASISLLLSDRLHFLKKNLMKLKNLIKIWLTREKVQNSK